MAALRGQWNGSWLFAPEVIDSQRGWFRFLCTFFSVSVFFYLTSLWIFSLYSHCWLFRASCDFCDNVFLATVFSGAHNPEPSCTGVTAFYPTNYLKDGFGANLKYVLSPTNKSWSGKTNRLKKDISAFWRRLVFFSDILYFECSHRRRKRGKSALKRV